MYVDIKNLPSTVKTLNRSHDDEGKRNQSFSLARTSNRVRLDDVDHSLLTLRSPARKLATAQEYKRQSYETPLRQLAKIEKKLEELGQKLIKAIRLGKDTTAIDALILRLQYHRHTNNVRLNELNEKAIERDEAKAILMLPVDQVPVFDRPIIPASVGRTYKAGRKVLKDRIVKHGPADVGHVAIKPHKAPRKGKDVAKALRLELKRLAKARTETE
jgi:hypothetical protein